MEIGFASGKVHFRMLSEIVVKGCEGIGFVKIIWVNPEKKLAGYFFYGGIYGSTAALIRLKYGVALGSAGSKYGGVLVDNYLHIIWGFIVDQNHLDFVKWIALIQNGIQTFRQILFALITGHQNRNHISRKSVVSHVV